MSSEQMAAHAERIEAELTARGCSRTEIGAIGQMVLTNAVLLRDELSEAQLLEFIEKIAKSMRECVATWRSPIH